MEKITIIITNMLIPNFFFKNHTTGKITKDANVPGKIFEYPIPKLVQNNSEIFLRFINLGNCDSGLTSYSFFSS